MPLKSGCLFVKIGRLPELFNPIPALCVKLLDKPADYAAVANPGYCLDTRKFSSGVTHL